MKRLVYCCVLVLVPLIASAEPAEKETSGDRAKLHGKWIVRSVQRDGKPTVAQMGRKVGDIITIKKAGHHLMLS